MQDLKINPDEADHRTKKNLQAPLSRLLEEGNLSPAIALRGPQRREWIRCMISPAYFIDLHCTIEDKVKRGWVAFHLWLAQYRTLCKVISNHQVIILKARQLGLTSLMTCFALWKMIFRPGCGILLFSRRNDEATELLDRIRGVHNRLPGFLQQVVTIDNARELSFGDQDSWAKAFSTTRHSGRSYTATLAIIDEADFIPLLKQLLNAVKPTIDAGGKLVILSTVDKEHRNSEFKRLWNQATRKMNNYVPIFLPWTARPDRDHEWYQKQKEDYEEDDLYQEYPATPEEAIAPRKSSKRFDPKWIAKCRGIRARGEGGGGLNDKEHVIQLGSSDELHGKMLAIPGLRVYVEPGRGRVYLVAADPAEGNPSSDPSAGSILDCESWEQVGVIYGRFEPDIFANYLVQIAKHYNGAKICWERNNHGHAVEIAIRYLEYSNIYISPFDKKPGWLSNARNKVLAVDYCAQVLREGSCRINDEITINELAMFEASKLRAPEGEHDDLAMTIIIGLAALRWKSFEEERGEGMSALIPGEDPVEGLGFEG